MKQSDEEIRTSALDDESRFYDKLYDSCPAILLSQEQEHGTFIEFFCIQGSENCYINMTRGVLGGLQEKTVLAFLDAVSSLKEKGILYKIEWGGVHRSPLADIDHKLMYGTRGAIERTAELENDSREKLSRVGSLKGSFPQLSQVIAEPSKKWKK